MEIFINTFIKSMTSIWKMKARSVNALAGMVKLLKPTTELYEKSGHLQSEIEFNLIANFSDVINSILLMELVWCHMSVFFVIPLAPVKDKNGCKVILQLMCDKRYYEKMIWLVIHPTSFFFDNQCDRPVTRIVHVKVWWWNKAKRFNTGGEGF